MITENAEYLGYYKTIQNAEMEMEKMSVLTITANNFEKEVIQSDKPVLLDFWAEWCGPCRMLSPTVETIASEVSDIKVGKINVDEESDLARQFKVMTIPTLVILKDGKVVQTSVGVKSKDAILQLLQL